MSGASDVFKSVASVLSFGLADKALGISDKPEEPKEKTPEVAPVADDAAKRRESMRQMQRRYGTRGRVSTMLSGKSNLG